MNWVLKKTNKPLKRQYFMVSPKEEKEIQSFPAQCVKLSECQTVRSVY